MQLTPNRLFVLFLVAILSFIGTGIVHYRAIETLITNQRNQVSQRLIAIELQNLLSLAVEAETGQRGFVITGMDSYLAPYHNARKRIPALIAALRNDLSGDPGQLQRLNEIERLQRLKLAELAESIEARRQSGFLAAQAIVLTNQGKALMDAMREVVAEMDRIERAKIDERTKQSAESARQALRTILVAGMLDVALLLILFFVVRTDARRRETAAHELATAQTLLRNVIDSSPALIYLKDLSGKFLLVNQAFERLFGGNASRTPNTPNAVLPDEHDTPRPSAADLEVIRYGAEVQFEEMAETSEGKKYFFVSKLPLRNHEGHIVGICAVSADVTPLKNAETEIRLLNQTLEKRVEDRTRELAQVNSQLQDANAQLEAFSYTVAHDLRAPLRGIQGFADAVGEDYADVLDDVGRDYLQRISRAATRMERLIEDLLAFSRLSRMELPAGTVALDDVMAEVTANLGAQIKESAADVHIDPRLPQVRANRAACVQVFQNLVSNAIKFAKPDTQPVVKVRAECRQNEQDETAHVRVWIEDCGIGIPEEQQQRIFRPFERLHGIDEYPGSGIGLAVVDKAVRRMQGSCGVESASRAGSRFWVELPAVKMET